MSNMVRVRGWSRTRWSSWWSIIRIVPQAGRAVPVAALLNLVIGLLPLGFVVATSVAIDRGYPRSAIRRTAPGDPCSPR